MTKRRTGWLGAVWTVLLLAGCMAGSESDAKLDPPRGIGDGEDSNGTAKGGGGSVLSPTTGMAASAPASDGDFGSPAPEAPPAAGPAASGAAGASGSAGAGGSASASDSSDGASSEPEPIDSIARPGNPPAQSGVLTAGAWDDNVNFDRFSDFRSDLLQSGTPGLWPTTDEEHADAHELFSGERDAHTTLDIALVIDTTGSMGDELAFLQTELLDISRTIEAQHPDAEQRWSLVVYKDEGDEYVTRWFDFREDADDFRAKLTEQSAGGGGDFPEAPDQAFEVMNQLAWRKGGDTARLVFWVADAPAHDDKVEAMADAVRDAAEQDIHVYPVASSGIDTATELGMRSAAQLTGGRYLFLTDDSGVGGTHLEPSIPCYFVTRLDQAIVRMVDIELSGEYSEPDSAEVIRTGGDPEDRACTLESGDEVLAF